MSILFAGLCFSIMAVFLEKIINHCLKNKDECHKKSKDYMRGYVEEYFKNENILEKGDQIKQLKRFFDLSLNIIHQDDKYVIDED